MLIPKTVNEISLQCEAQGVPFDCEHWMRGESEFVCVGESVNGWANYSPSSGRINGRDPHGFQFEAQPNAGSVRAINAGPWNTVQRQAMLNALQAFFWKSATHGVHDVPCPSQGLGLLYKGFKLPV